MKYSITILSLFLSSLSFTQPVPSQPEKYVPVKKIPVLIRCDDIGMCHAVNVAAKEVLEKRRH